MVLLEEWKEIKNCNGNYLISNFGKVKSVRNNLILKTSLDKDGYNRLSLRNKNKPIYCRISKLVATYFVPNPDNLTIVNHIDNTRNNDIFTNLEWVSVRENTCHGIKLNKKLPIGVSKRPKQNKYRARIEINRKSISLGDFNTPEEASEAYKKALQTYKIKNKYD